MIVCPAIPLPLRLPHKPRLPEPRFRQPTQAVGDYRIFGALESNDQDRP